MSYWMCMECDYVFEAGTPGEECPSCHAKCVFADVTCYIPDCGGPEHLDTQLVAQRSREFKKSMGASP